MKADNDSNAALGRWAQEDFATTVSLHGGVGADADVPDQHRFVAGVVQLIRKRTAELEVLGENDDNDIAIFVLRPKPPETIAHARRVPMIDNGLTVVVGRLWFATAPVSSAHFVELPPDSSDDCRFTYVAETLQLGSQPTLIFDPRTATPELRWYPGGLGQPDKVELKPMKGDVNPDDVFEAIDELYWECFVTPDSLPQGVNLWRKAQEHWPQKNAEALLQSHLKAGLVLRFPHCKIRHEQPQQEGRSDLEIEEPNPLDRSSVTRHAILELKVLRSYRSTGARVSDSETNEWIREGVQQARSYRQSKHARWSALCCFDMRETDVRDNVTFAHVSGCANRLDVMLRRWFLYASAAAYREAAAAC